MRERVAILIGLAVVVGAVLAVLSVPMHSGYGSNSRISASGVSLPVPGRGGRRCQYDERIPGGAGTMRIYVNTFGRRAGPVDVLVAVPGLRPARGVVPPLRRLGALDVRVASSLPGSRAGTVCFVNRGPSAVALGGDLTEFNPKQAFHPLDLREDARIDWFSSRGRSWWSEASQAASRFALFKPGFVGPWTFYALGGLFLLVAAWAVWLVYREPSA
jgi:hypothetical protein